MNSINKLICAIEIVAARLGSVDNIQIQPISLNGQSSVYLIYLSNRKICLKLEGADIIHLKREAHFLRMLKSNHFPKLILDEITNGFICEEWIDGFLFFRPKSHDDLLGYVDAVARNRDQVLRELEKTKPALVLCDIKRNLYLEEVLEGQVVWIQGIPFRLASRSYLLRNLRTIACDLAQILDELTGTSPAIIHRDIKPRNLYFRVPESQVTLVDFGSAEHEGTRALTQPNVFPKLGTCKYIYTPFEQLTSQPSQDRRVDVFAAASVIFEILEGKPPYDNAVAGYQEALAYYKKREYEIWQTLQNRHPKLRRALFDALRVDPLERSRDLWDVAKALERTLSNE